MEYLATYYIKNENSAKVIFNTVPYQSTLLSGREDEVLEIVGATLRKYPYFRCCSIMEKTSSFGREGFEMKYMLDNPYYKEEALNKKYKVEETVEHREIDDDFTKLSDDLKTKNPRLGIPYSTHCR